MLTCSLRILQVRKLSAFLQNQQPLNLERSAILPQKQILPFEIINLVFQTIDVLSIFDARIDGTEDIGFNREPHKCSPIM